MPVRLLRLAEMDSGTKTNTVTLNIGGSKYRMATDSAAEDLRRLGEVINARIEELGPKAVRSGSPAHVLAIVSLTLAEELEVSKSRQDQQQRSVQDSVQEALAQIDAVLAAAARLDSI